MSQTTELLRAIAGIVLLVAVASAALILWRKRLAGPRTDRGHVIDGATRARDFPEDAPSEPDDATKQKDAERRKTLVGRAAKRCNCMGFSFGQGNWEIPTEEVPRILADNYVGVVGRAKVCMIIVWPDGDGGYDHSGLVIEVSEDGRPVSVRSKATISNFVYDHPPDVEPYGGNYELYERNPQNLDPATQQEIADLQKAYDAIADKSSREAHDAAARLCQKKNALRGS